MELDCGAGGVPLVLALHAWCLGGRSVGPVLYMSASWVLDCHVRCRRSVLAEESATCGTCKESATASKVHSAAECPVHGWMADMSKMAGTARNSLLPSRPV